MAIHGSPCVIEYLPNELLLHIFSELPISDLGRATRVCRNWSKLTTDNSLVLILILINHAVDKLLFKQEAS